MLVIAGQTTRINWVIGKTGTKLGFLQPCYFCKLSGSKHYENILIIMENFEVQLICL